VCLLTPLIMHRKSAYILFLAVLGLLVIGIVMLFSTSAFARDSQETFIFLSRGSRFGSGSGWRSASSLR